MPTPHARGWWCGAAVRKMCTMPCPGCRSPIGAPVDARAAFRCALFLVFPCDTSFSSLGSGSGRAHGKRVEVGTAVLLSAMCTMPCPGCRSPIGAPVDARAAFRCARFLLSPHQGMHLCNGQGNRCRALSGWKGEVIVMAVPVVRDSIAGRGVMGVASCPSRCCFNSCYQASRMPTMSEGHWVWCGQCEEADCSMKTGGLAKETMYSQETRRIYRGPSSAVHVRSWKVDAACWRRRGVCHAGARTPAASGYLIRWRGCGSTRAARTTGSPPAGVPAPTAGGSRWPATAGPASAPERSWEFWQQLRTHAGHVVRIVNLQADGVRLYIAVYLN